ncbi:hypothetical protein [Vagococcus acidifermentans]|nr:hypothetical protein [Vagococcus acidifermentans]
MIIDVNNLTFKFKNKIIFNDASFRIKSSGIYGLVALMVLGKRRYSMF